MKVAGLILGCLSTNRWGLKVPEAIPKAAGETRMACTSLWGSVVAVLDEQRLLRGYREIADTPKAAGEILAAFSVVG